MKIDDPKSDRNKFGSIWSGSGVISNPVRWRRSEGFSFTDLDLKQLWSEQPATTTMLSCRRLLSKSLKRKKKKKKLTAPRHKKLQKQHLSVEELPFFPSSCDQEDGEEDVGGYGFSLKSTAPSHTHGVQPLGNLYFSSSSSHNSRDSGLGSFNILTDELVLDVLGFLEGPHLGVLSTVSRAFYVFCSHEPLWRNLVLDTATDGFSYTETWKLTYVSTYKPDFDVAKVKGLVVRDFYSDYLFQSWLCANMEMKAEWLERDNIQRRRGTSVEEFISKFEEPNKPVLLEGCIDGWDSLKKWDKSYLIEACGDSKFAVGPVEMTLMDYFRYSEQAREERPLYLFDPKFAEKVPQLSKDYQVPVYFREDLFSILGNDRPDYRWIIMGPAGSGSSFHVDPNSTSAWNAVIKGSKKWVLFPPEVVPPGVHPSPDGAEVACPVSILEWFMNFYDAAREGKRKPIECVCKAGEVIFVPNGWWHLVINLEESIAITQNYVSRCNVLNVLDFLKRPNACTLVSGTKDRVNLYEKFKSALDTSFPGMIDNLTAKAEERAAQQSLSFWDTVTDSKAGVFKFSF